MDNVSRKIVESGEISIRSSSISTLGVHSTMQKGSIRQHSRGKFTFSRFRTWPRVAQTALSYNLTTSANIMFWSRDVASFETSQFSEFNISTSFSRNILGAFMQNATALPFDCA